MSKLDLSALPEMVFYVVVAILAGIAAYFHLLPASTFNDVAFVVLGLIFPTAKISNALAANTAETAKNTAVVVAAAAPTAAPTGNQLPVNTNPNVKG